MMLKDVQNAVRVDKGGKDEAFQSPGDYVRFISPEVYRSNRQKYLRSYTFKSYADQENLSSPKKQTKWFKNKKIKAMKIKKTTTDSLGNSLKTCLRLLFSCFHV